MKKKMSRAKASFTGICLFTLFLLSAVSKTIYAQDGVIDATIRISVCGDGVAEYPEECDNADLGSSSCEAFGYDRGSISCNSDCTANTTLCSFDPTSTPTPTFSNSEENATSDTSTSTSSDEKSDSDQITTAVPTVIPSPGNSIVEQVVVNIIDRLPDKVAFFDPNTDNKLTNFELRQSITMWFDYWKSEEEQEKCDLNQDKTCDVRDFSVLLYYFN